MNNVDDVIEKMKILGSEALEGAYKQGAIIAGENNQILNKTLKSDLGMIDEFKPTVDNLKTAVKSYFGVKLNYDIHKKTQFIKNRAIRSVDLNDEDERDKFFTETANMFKGYSGYASEDDIARGVSNLINTYSNYALEQKATFIKNTYNRVLSYYDNPHKLDLSEFLESKDFKTAIKFANDAYGINEANSMRSNYIKNAFYDLANSNLPNSEDILKKAKEKGVITEEEYNTGIKHIRDFDDNPIFTSTENKDNVKPQTSLNYATRYPLVNDTNNAYINEQSPKSKSILPTGQGSSQNTPHSQNAVDSLRNWVPTPTPNNQQDAVNNSDAQILHRAISSLTPSLNEPNHILNTYDPNKSDEQNHLNRVFERSKYERDYNPFMDNYIQRLKQTNPIDYYNSTLSILLSGNSQDYDLELANKHFNTLHDTDTQAYFTNLAMLKYKGNAISVQRLTNSFNSSGNAGQSRAYLIFSQIDEALTDANSQAMPNFHSIGSVAENDFIKGNQALYNVLALEYLEKGLSTKSTEGFHIYSNSPVEVMNRLKREDKLFTDMTNNFVYAPTIDPISKKSNFNVTQFNYSTGKNEIINGHELQAYILDRFIKSYPNLGVTKFDHLVNAIPNNPYSHQYYVYKAGDDILGDNYLRDKEGHPIIVDGDVDNRKIVINEEKY